ncbi:MAG: lipopolysaccharide biosynthesis protein, partial [Paracoccaceae bacterium]
GQVVFFLNSALFLSVLGARGQQIAILRFVPPLLAGDAPRWPAHFMRRALTKAGTGTFLVWGAVTLTALGAQSFGALPGYGAIVLILGFALIPAVAAIDLLSHLARACALIQLSLIPKEIAWRGLAALAILAIFFATGQRPPGAITTLTILLTTLLLLTLAQYFVLRTRTRDLRTHTQPARAQSCDKRTTTAFWITSVSNIFLANVDVMLVAIFIGPRAAGLYFAANRLAMLLAFFTTSYNVVLAPMLSQAWHTGRQIQAQTIIHSAALRAGLPTLLFGLALAAFAPQALRIFGPEFDAATTALRLLVLAGLINALGGPADIALNMCGHERAAMRASAAALAIGALLLLTGALSGSITGVALAVLLATAARKAMFWWLALHHMGLRADALSFWFAAPDLRAPTARS